MSKSGLPSESPHLIAVLRQNLAEGLQPPAAILHATAEAARTLTGADGAALALRTKGLIVCRARSGDPSPELGALLNADSGISGECLRTASILVCGDAANDARVDPDVCQFLEIKSIVVVPLRGPSGIAGILEAFSNRVGAFGEEQINFLRALAGIAEEAYGREIRGLQDAPTPPLKPARIRMLSDEEMAPATAKQQRNSISSPARRIWFIVTAVAAILLVTGVWLGYEPGLETSAKESSTQPYKPATESLSPTNAATALPKPWAGITRSDRLSGDRPAADVVKSAARIEIIDSAEPSDRHLDSPGPAAAVAGASTSSIPELSNPATATSTNEPSKEQLDQLARLVAAPNTLPSLDAPVSQGVIPGRPIHKVEPVYPPEARTRRIAGSVALEIMIAEDGSVREVEEISGSPILAAAASKALRQWRYTPFRLNGKAIEVQKQITVVFKLP